jgi:Lrp/AsnC family transcriptional regulator for asnA, asnC and gidA
MGSGLVTGRYPLMALVNTNNVDDLKRIVGKVAQHKIIRSVKYILLHKQYKSVAEFNPLSDKVNLLSANNKIIKLTNVDHKILSMLTKDCKKPYTEISKELGIQPTTVKTRIEKLTDSGVIMRSNAVLDYGKLGFTELACMLIQFDAEHKTQEEKILNKYAKFPEILSLTSLSGEFDVFVIGIFKSKESLAQFLHKLNSIPGIDIMIVEIIYIPLIGPLMNHVKL